MEKPRWSCQDQNSRNEKTETAMAKKTPSLRNERNKSSENGKVERKKSRENTSRTFLAIICNGGSSEAGSLLEPRRLRTGFMNASSGSEEGIMNQLVLYLVYSTPFLGPRVFRRMIAAICHPHFRVSFKIVFSKDGPSFAA